MAKVSTYLNFPGNTEEAFTYYQSVFQTDFCAPIARFGSAPPCPEHTFSEAEKNLVIHVSLPILGGHILMGTDAPASLGFNCKPGNNVHINLEPDTRAEADRLFAALSAGGKVEMAMQVMFWGDYFGSFSDRFGVQWMINCNSKI